MLIDMVFPPTMIHRGRYLRALNKRPTRPLIRDSPARLSLASPSSPSHCMELLCRSVECQVVVLCGRSCPGQNKPFRAIAAVSLPFCGFWHRFEIGGTDEQRTLEAFSDEVIAINIALMVLEMKIPHRNQWKELLAVTPTFLTYVLSFVYVGIYWNNHQPRAQFHCHLNKRQPPPRRDLQERRCRLCARQP
jgi:hypothetical protein